MESKYLFIRITMCALCILGTQEVAAQKMYTTKVDDNNSIIILDCGPDSGFPQQAVETTAERKTISDPKNDAISSNDNLTTGKINETVYIMLEIAKTNESNEQKKETLNWATAYKACINKNTGGTTGWRLPTLRELKLMWIFRDVIKQLGGDLGTYSYWSATEGSEGYAIVENMEHAYSGNNDKTNEIGYRVRCVREIPYTQEATNTKK